MHQHREGVHAHVARAVDGRKMIELLKRDDGWSDNMRAFIHRPQHNTNGEHIMLNIPAGFAEKDSTNDSGVATAVDVVYVTVSPSFTGSVLGYVTASAANADASIAPAAITTPSTAATSSTQAIVAAISSSSAAQQLSSATSTAAVFSVGTPVATTKSSAVTAASTTPVTNYSAQQDASVSQQQQQQDTGMTSAAKAGLAFGIIAALALVAGLFFFCYKRSKKNHGNDEINEKAAHNEKRSSFFGGGALSSTKRASVDSDKSFGTVHPTATAPRLSLRPVTQFLPTFGDKRKSENMLGGPQMSEKASAWDRRPQNTESPFVDAAAHSDKQANPFDEGDGRSIHSNSSAKSWETAEAAPTGAAAAAGAQRGPNNVHRVQLDFKPSMDDELELKSGQLVRMLHEYDDGWALCVRMDRSQQGVAPRTCLSKTPVKPRGPPPGGRVSPQNHMRGPAPGSRPMTPQQQPQQSPSLSRKPVPGQAI